MTIVADRCQTVLAAINAVPTRVPSRRLMSDVDPGASLTRAYPSIEACSAGMTVLKSAGWVAQSAKTIDFQDHRTYIVTFRRDCRDWLLG